MDREYLSLIEVVVKELAHLNPRKQELVLNLIAQELSESNERRAKEEGGKGTEGNATN